jgi:hypothetical protein
MKQTDQREGLAYPVTDTLLVPYLNQNITVGKASAVHIDEEPSLFSAAAEHRIFSILSPVRKQVSPLENTTSLVSLHIGTDIAIRFGLSSEFAIR